METVNLILSIAASVLSIISVIWSRNNSKSIRKLSQNVTIGDNTSGNVGNNNRIQNGQNNTQ